MLRFRLLTPWLIVGLSVLGRPHALFGQAVVPMTAPGDAPAAVPTALPPAQTSEELTERYQQVVAAMKRPPVSGVLIAEFGPNSAALAAGCRPGDIITGYAERDITTEASLRQAVAASVAEARLDAHAAPRVRLQVRRLTVSQPRGEMQTLFVARGPLGITGLETEAGVPLGLNPAGTPRGDFVMEWGAVPTLEPPTGKMMGQELWTRLYQGSEWVGFERTRVDKAGGTWTLAVTSWQVDHQRVVGQQTAVIGFTASDNRQAPGFGLEVADLEDTVTGTRATIEKKGATIRGSIDPLPGSAGRHENVARPTAVIGQSSGIGVIPVYALPVAAAALPQRADIVAPFAQLSEADWQTRLGYAFKTLGKVSVSGAGELWAVQVLHMGRAEMTFYFSDQRELVRAELGAGLVAQRVGNEDEARRELIEEK